MEARIHLTGPDQEQPSPPHCSACFGAKPAEPHVDFSAHYDGPMVPALEGTVGVVGHSIDELIICAECLATAAALIGLEDVTKLREQLDTRRAETTRLHEQLEAQAALIEQLEGAKTARDALAQLTRPASPRRREKAPA